MPKIEIKEAINEQEWEEYVLKNPYSTMFLSWNWGGFEQSQGKKFERFSIYKDGKIAGVLPISKVIARRGKYLHLRHAPLLDWSDNELVREMVAFLKQYAKKSGAHFIRVSPLLLNSRENNNLLSGLGFKRATSHEVDAELTVVLDLEKSLDEILMSMRKTTRYSIRKAEKMGVEILHTNGMEYFDEFLKVYWDTVKRQKWPPYSENYIKSEYELFAGKEQAHMFVAKYKGEVASAAIFIHYNGQSIYHHSGSLSSLQKVPTSYLLQWESIKFAKEKGMKRYNFWGVSPADKPGHPWYGLSLFKRGFGAQELEFVHAQDLIVHPFAYVTRVYETVENKRRGF